VNSECTKKRLKRFITRTTIKTEPYHCLDGNELHIISRNDENPDLAQKDTPFRLLALSTNHSLHTVLVHYYRTLIYTQNYPSK